jgi:hypothetical protein
MLIIPKVLRRHRPVRPAESAAGRGSAGQSRAGEVGYGVKDKLNREP